MSLVDPPALAARWYLVRTRPNCERLATEHLERQGFSVYLPRLPAVRRARSRAAAHPRPLFPRYLFLGLLDEGQSTVGVNFTRGVSGLVRFGQELARVPARVVDGLRRCADPFTGLHHVGVARLFAGARVKVVGGMFEGVEGVFQCERGDRHAVVMLELLGQSARVCLEAEHLQPAEDRRPAWAPEGAVAC